ncbi:MAG: hypothetical protein KDD55_02680 [Bdellovibrionales bacterium]|nr:hypothetical protein [Bdellovibrionales bacterium]
MKLFLPVGFLFLVSLTTFAFQGLQNSQRSLHDDAADEQEVLYLPNGQGLHFLSFGYQNMLSDLLWFQTISYFGKHYQSDRNYTWLAHMCGLVVELNPLAEHVFDFCGTMLAWEAHAVEQANALLDKAIMSKPDRWRYYYLRGFNSLYFLRDQQAAQKDFLLGSQQPDAPPFLLRLAVKNLDVADPASTQEFLLEMLHATTDETQKQVLMGKLRELYRKNVK